MRTIKFRAWDKEEKVMRDADDTGDGKALPLNTLVKSLTTRSFELMQFTGLLDKNGKEIYEGDIVMSPNYEYDPSEGDNPRLLNTVSYRHAFFSYDGSPMDEDECSENVEIIGNIYSNPELLK